MDAFWLDPVDRLQSSGTLILKHPSRSFGTFGRKIGTHFDPNLQKSNEKTMFPNLGRKFNPSPLLAPAEFTKKAKNPKFHSELLEKVQIWTKNSTHYPFSPPAEFTKKNKKSKVPLWMFRKGPKLDQKFDPLPLLATG